MIGTDVTGAVSDPDGQPGNGDELGNGKGIIVNDAPGVIIANNVVAGSTGIGVDFGYGIHIANVNASGAVVRGNRIGVNAVGNGVLANKADGVFIERASNITIGGTVAADRNIISGNGGDGVAIFGRTCGTRPERASIGKLHWGRRHGRAGFWQQIPRRPYRFEHANNTVGGDAPAAGISSPATIWTV